MRKVVWLVGALVLACVVPSWAAGTCTATVSVGTSSTKLLDSSDVPTGRAFLLIQNIGAQDAHVTIGETATTSKGFTLSATGNGSLKFTSTQGANGIFISVPNAQVNAIVGSATTNLSICDY